MGAARNRGVQRGKPPGGITRELCRNRAAATEPLLELSDQLAAAPNRLQNAQADSRQPNRQRGEIYRTRHGDNNGASRQQGPKLRGRGKHF